MQVTILSCTENPMQVISRAAGTSYGKDDFKHKRVRHCYENGHMSVFEHASITFKVEGISRACSHQLVRHRMASFCQESQRYTKIDTSEDWYIEPNAFRENNLGSMYRRIADECAEAYKRAIDSGVKPEDARYLLPEATKTALTVTMNVRELFHFLDLREDSHAQWEIRDMADTLDSECEHINGEWGELMGLRNAE